MTFDMTELVDQKTEATGVDGNCIDFNFRATEGENVGEVLNFIVPDPSMLTDEQQEDLAELPNFAVDIAAWYLGEEQYEKFREAGGQSWMVRDMLQSVAEERQAKDAAGRPTRPNRSSRRARRR